MAEGYRRQAEDGQDANQFVFVVDDGAIGYRLDHYLVAQLPDQSRSHISSAIKSGLISINGSSAKASRKLRKGDTVYGYLEQTSEPELAAENIHFSIIHEDNDLLVLSKPPGLVVHPGSGNPRGTLVNGLLRHSQDIANVGNPARPGIVHRLDKDTSGVMVIAKSAMIHRALVNSFKNREVKKKYHTIVVGYPDTLSGRIVAPIGRHPVQRTKMAVNHLRGRYAATNYRVIKMVGGLYSFVEVEIETGRTHQIRVHMASEGYPVAGDDLYGHKVNRDMFPRQMLHATEICFTHPGTQKYCCFTAPLWPDMELVLDSLEKLEMNR